MPKQATPSIPPPQSPLHRAIYLSSVCRAAGLDDYDAGWVAGTLQALGAENLSPDGYMRMLNDLISDCRNERIILESEGIDPDDARKLNDYIAAKGKKLNDYIEANRAVIQ